MIEAEGLTKHFGDVEALAGLDLAVPSGQVLAILGPQRRGQDHVDPHDRHAHPTDRRARLQVAGIDVAKHPKQVRRIDRPRRAVRRGRARADRPREPPHGRAAVRSRPRRGHEGRRRGARADGPHRRRRPAGAHVLGRHAAPPRPRGQPRRRAPPAAARRADHRSRPAQPQRAVGRDRGAWRRAAPTCCSPRSTSTKPTVSPTSSRSSTTASSWRPAPATS